MDEMLRAVSRYPNGTSLIIEWTDGGVISVEIDTIYETNNELEPEDRDYREFYACLLIIVNILKHSKWTNTFTIGDLMEISMYNSPSRILLKGGKLIWEKT